MALRLQDAQWIPCAIEFDPAYEYKITALVDKVEIVQERSKSGSYFEPEEEVVVGTLNKGELLRGKII